MASGVRVFTPLRIAGALVGLVLAAGVALYLVPSNDYLLLPDGAHPVAPLVRVQGGHNPKDDGGIYFVDVFERRASMLESLFPFIRSGSTLVPADLLVPPGLSDTAQRQADLREMTVSQQVAAAVALRRLGYHVVAKPNGVIVDAVDLGTHAVGKLEPTDVIVSVNGVATPTVARLRSVLAHTHPGQVARLGVRRGAEQLTVSVKTIADPQDPRRAIVGFAPDQSALIKLPLRVQINAGNVGGPSAGLAFALEVMEKLGRNVDRGYKVAATGQLDLDGAVEPIGGVKQKTFGVREAKADVFLVPAGDNAAEARRYAHGLRIIAVKSFPQALRALATLPLRH
ncbi:MAG TPA: PDZ domain-containing protein [Gaiellaceae bacterium]|nr:PDZ domain-containing protein [Gaiellaceae bacterium]